MADIFLCVAKFGSKREKDRQPFQEYPSGNGTNISPLKVAGKMSFLFHWWDVLVPWKV